MKTRSAIGSIVVQDVRSGEVLISASIGDGATSLPLSTVKLMLAAIYWQHKAQLPKPIMPDMYALIAQGKDDPGRILALELRRALGSGAMLDDLRRGDTARYTVVTYVRHGGYGGGTAAEISADAAAFLLSEASKATY